MKRFVLLPVSTRADGARTADVPPAVTGWVCVHDFVAQNRMLVKMSLSDGTPQDATTIADVMFDIERTQIDIEASPLSATARTTIKTHLAIAGFDTSRIDAAITDRKKLLQVFLRWIANRTDTDNTGTLLSGWDAA